MSGTDLGMLLPGRRADRAYDQSAGCLSSYACPTRCPVLTEGMLLRTPCALSGTHIGYAPPHAIPSTGSGMLLRTRQY
eukprot:1514823-Rhodomonas_salina.2